MPDQDVSPEAQAAGWNPEDGPAPYEHGAFKEPLGSGTDREALVAEAEAAQR